MVQKKCEREGPLLPWEGLSGASCNDGRSFDHWADTATPIYNTSGSKNWVEPKQGCINDCWFIAALVSVALTKNVMLCNHPNNYRFFDTDTNMWGNYFAINDELPVDASGNLVYARTSSGYIWPCLYEKAYAIWKSGKQNPNYLTEGKLDGGVAPNGLRSITGGAFGPLKTLPGYNPITKRPLYPAVASTKDTVNSGLLIAGHDYSIVKIYTGGCQLRNPCGGGLVDISTAVLNADFKDWRYVVV